MKRRGHGRLTITLVLLLTACATTGPPEKEPFNVSHVTVYDCGLAQLERQATVNGARELEIELEQAHLDDLLSTLVLATDGSVKVKGVKYPAVLNMAQARAASSFANMLWDEDNESVVMPHSIESYVQALMGTSVSVELAKGESLHGTVLDYSAGTAVPVNGGGDENANKGVAETARLLLVGPDGGVSWIPVGSITRIVPESKREAEALQKFARQLGKTTGLDETTIVIQTAEDSSGRLAAGYVRQAPVWRMAYKVTADRDNVVLEAWAVVHNDTNEEWEDISLTLVSGLPKSYVLSVASPRYAERETLYADQDFNMFPQLGASTPDSLLYDQGGLLANSVTMYGASGHGGYGYGGGSSAISMGRSMSGHGVVRNGVVETDSPLLQVGVSAAEEMAEPKVEQEISTYRALETVSIPGRSSNMVPLMRKKLPGQAFTLVGEGHGRPATCVRMENETGLVLQYGVGSFYINGRFRGQAELQRTEPGDLRVLCFGEDPDMTWTTKTERKRTPRKLEWKQDRLWIHALVKSTVKYEMSNNAGQPRRVGIEFSHRRNGRILSPSGVLESEDAKKLVLVNVPAREETEQVIVLEEGVMTSVPLCAENLKMTVKTTELPEEQRRVVAEALKIIEKAEKIDAQVCGILHETVKVGDSIDRRKKNLEAVPKGVGSSRVLDKMLEDLMASEKKLERLIDEKDMLTEQAENVREQATKILARLEKNRVGARQGRVANWIPKRKFERCVRCASQYVGAYR